MSGGLGPVTPEALQRWDVMWRRVEELVAHGARSGEAYDRAMAERDYDERQRRQDERLADIRENGT